MIFILVPRGIDGKGGIERQMRYVLSELAKTENLPAVRVLSPRGTASYPVAAWAFVDSIARYVAAICTGQVDLLHVNLSANGSTLRKFWFVLASRMSGVPVIIHLHGSEYIGFLESLPGFGRSLVQWMFRSADRVITLGSYWADFAIHEIGIDRGSVCVIPNAVPPISANVRSNEGCRHILFLGRVGERKGVPELLSALAGPELRSLNWRATIAGDGDRGSADIERYRAMARAQGIADRVCFPGWVDPEQAHRLLLEADVFTLPSHSENLPVALLEAMAASLPIVATAVGAIPEVVRAEKDALLIEPGDIAGLSRALASLVRDRDLGQRLGRAAFARYAANYSLSAYVVRLLKLYDDVLSERRGQGLIAAPRP